MILNRDGCVSFFIISNLHIFLLHDFVAAVTTFFAASFPAVDATATFAPTCAFPTFHL